MINLFKYNLINENYLYILGLCIYFFLQKSKMISIENILPIIVTLLILYTLILYLNKQNNLYNGKYIISHKFNFNKYPYLGEDTEVLSILSNIGLFYDKTNIKYRNLLKSINIFFRYYNKFKNSILNKNDYSQIYENSLFEAKNVLNTINSFGTLINYQDKNFHYLSKEEELYIPDIKTINNRLQKILSKYLTYMEIINNKEWYQNNININSSPIYPGDIEANTTDSDAFMVY